MCSGECDDAGSKNSLPHRHHHHHVHNTHELQGDPDAFMAAIGMGWLKRKAVGVALSLGFGSHGYDVHVVKDENGFYTVTISVSAKVLCSGIGSLGV